eukprot:1158547-Pelagomonas_calceolata.AAC.2
MHTRTHAPGTLHLSRAARRAWLPLARPGPPAPLHLLRQLQPNSWPKLLPATVPRLGCPCNRHHTGLGCTMLRTNVAKAAS